MIRNSLRWHDMPSDCGPHKTVYNRCVRWNRQDVFGPIFSSLTARAGEPDIV
ncbi:transposase [Pseudahrensia aquimaris]|uniref:Transposase n=1 Tax=Pseudahrensia aquimaris TaxID=744461 RepID=A0ABW3FJ67_9HYPH